MSQGLPNPGFMQEKVQKGDFLRCPMMKKFLTHFSDSIRQECMVFAKIGYGSCYHHWREIFAGVTKLRTRLCLHQFWMTLHSERGESNKTNANKVSYEA